MVAGAAWRDEIRLNTSLAVLWKMVAAGLLGVTEDGNQFAF